MRSRTLSYSPECPGSHVWSSPRVLHLQLPVPVIQVVDVAELLAGEEHRDADGGQQETERAPESVDGLRVGVEVDIRLRRDEIINQVSVLHKAA